MEAEVQYEPRTLPELYEQARKEVYAEIERNKGRVKSTQKKEISAEMPPCLKYILTSYPKTDNTNFNKLVALNIIPWFQRAGYDYQQALDIILPFLKEYPHSTAYTTEEDRIKHFDSEWKYIEANPQYVFECSFILGLGLPGSAFECKECHLGKIEGTKEKEPERKVDIPLGGRIPKDVADEIVSEAPPSLDADLRQTIRNCLLPGQNQPPAMTRRLEAGRFLLEWLNKEGGFLKSEEGDLYYFHRKDRRLYPLDSERWLAWLYSLSGVNPAGTDFSYLNTDCKTAAMYSPKRKVIRFAQWDGVALRVSCYNGTVFKLDGETITEEANGENALFLDDPSWIPYNPSFNSNEHLKWLTTDLPNWEDISEDENEDIEKHNQVDGSKMYGLVLLAWILSIFFSELCPTRPLAVLLGEKGSGKSMLLRLILRLLFGPLTELSGIPDKPDGFTAAAAATHLLAMDNLDDTIPWLRDKLASLSTGKMDEYRRLYTSNEVGRVYYRCWVCFTARTPDTLRRDDLTDRLLILPLKRLDRWDAERNFLTRVDELRSLWWGEVLTYLNKIVAEINKGQLESKSNLRLADWESLCRIAAKLEDSEPTWNVFVKNLKQKQSNFLLEGDSIVDALNLWLKDTRNHGKEMRARELHDELKAALYGDKKPTDWPKSARSLGKQLVAIRRDLKRLFNVTWNTDRKGFETYKFYPKVEGKEGKEEDPSNSAKEGQNGGRTGV